MRLIAINGSGSAFVDVSATLFCRRAEFIEDEATAPQGLNYKIAQDNSAAGFTSTFNVGPSTEPVTLGNPIASGHGAGPVIGAPAQVGGNLRSADKLASIQSRTVTSTNIRFTEYE